jgi:hypothetical protein
VTPSIEVVNLTLAETVTDAGELSGDTTTFNEAIAPLAERGVYPNCFARDTTLFLN